MALDVIFPLFSTLPIIGYFWSRRTQDAPSYLLLRVEPVGLYDLLNCSCSEFHPLIYLPLPLFAFEHK